MKRILSCIFILLLLCSCSKDVGFYESDTYKNQETSLQTQTQRAAEEEKIKAVWISCFELPSAENEAEFKKEIEKMISNIKKAGYNTIFVHVRPCADSIYPSEIFPWSKYCCNFKNPQFDPLEIIVTAAKENKIKIHAWINPFRISSTDDVKSIPQSSPAAEMIKCKSEDVKILPNGIYFNPASQRVHCLVYKGVEEILDNYDVDGIHLDDYFYPTTQEIIDKKQYEEYKKAGGKLEISQWRKDTISAFVAGLHQLTKSHNKILSISPSGNLEYNENKMYADIPLWMSEEGYADMIIPQIYYGFKHNKCPFKETARKWEKLKKNQNIKLVCGLANYKVNNIDENAGEKGKNEWIENKNLINEQIEIIKYSQEFDGISLFSYSYIF